MNFLRLSVYLIILTGSGCAHYTTPGGSVSLSELADSDINEVMSVKPAASFPANIAIARIQASGYRSFKQSSYGQGRYSIITTRDVESEADFQKLLDLENIAGIAPVNRLFLPRELNTIKSLRLAAARLKADILLIYTFDTSFNISGEPFLPLSLISLGFMSNKNVVVSTTATAAFFDVRTEYLYGISEVTVSDNAKASFWSSESVVDDLRFDTEKKAFKGLITEVGITWSKVLIEN